MKLTKDDRAAFVNAVMDDVPAVDYDELAHALIMNQVIGKLPKEIKAAWVRNDLRGFIQCNTYRSTPGSLRGVHTPPGEWSPDSDTMHKLESYADAKSAQKQGLASLEDKVRSVIATCTTLKQAEERLPEFVKYLPANRDGVNMGGLPIVANVVADLVDAGWPKGVKRSRGSK